MITVNIFNTITDLFEPVISSTQSLQVELLPYSMKVVLCYIKYVKGDETKTTLSFSFRDDKIPTNDYFNETILVENVCNKRVIEFTATGNFRFPVIKGLNEKQVRMSVEQVNVISSPGNIEIWVIPTLPFK